MHRRSVSLVLVAGLLAWSSGLLLDIHVHHADGSDEEHDSHDCQVCLVLHAGCAAVLPDAAPGLPGEQVSSPAIAEPISVPAVRRVAGAASPRAPPTC